MLKLIKVKVLDWAGLMTRACATLAVNALHSELPAHTLLSASISCVSWTETELEMKSENYPKIYLIQVINLFGENSEYTVEEERSWST